jgi:pimeloyl-ACP methyl ester carboxylesterase
MGWETPDFHGDFFERMAQFETLVGSQQCLLVGSSFGGLMAAAWAVRHPERVSRLVLLAPALHRPEFVFEEPVEVPTVLIHGRQDTVVPCSPVVVRAGEAFSNLAVTLVEDGHRLEETDWLSIACI